MEGSGLWRPAGLENRRRGDTRAFDSSTFRHAPLAEWFSTGLLLRGGRFDPFAAYVLRYVPDARPGLLNRASLGSTPRCRSGGPLEGMRRSEKGSRGSLARCNLLLAQWTEQPRPKWRVPGSTPGRET